MSNSEPPMSTTELMIEMFKVVDDKPGKRLIDVVEQSGATDLSAAEIGKSLKDSLVPGFVAIMPDLASPHIALLEAAVDETDWDKLTTKILNFGRKRR